MDRRVRYELLRSNEEEELPAEPVAVAVAAEEGAETGEQSETTVISTNNTEAVTIAVPPTYDIATSLPTYEEAELTKQTEDELRAQQERDQPQEVPNNTQRRVGDVYLGTDGIFICSFLLSFLFNFVGMFAIMCVSQTVAAWFGAVAGFGLSIVKYVALMKYQNWVGTTWNDGFSWLWWFMLFLGLLMFFRGCMQYIRIKHQWANLSQHIRGRIYLYF